VAAVRHAPTLSAPAGQRSASIGGVTAQAPTRLIVELPGLSVAALTWGPDDGPLALVLHGFPDTAWTWRHVGPRLAGAGWRVVAPFSRGYAPSGLPADGSYQLGALVHDVVGLHAALRPKGDPLLIGHDWGAMTAYSVSAFAPDLFPRIVAMSVPPLPTLQRVFRGPGATRLGLRQARCSWYIAANQIPGLSERAFRPLVRRLWADWSPGYDAEDDLQHVAAALPDVARRRAAISYYRAMAQPWRRSARYAAEQASFLAAPSVPTLYLHGDRDGALLPDVGAEVGADLAPGSRAMMVAGAGHFLQLEQPSTVAEAILRFAPSKGTAS
jgi:pimeloyl-ACP methyl ester carboxylesterase